jgi:biotin carboxylase
MKVALLLSLSYEMAYPVLRLARAAGWRTHVLGRYTAHGLQYSSACATYRDFEHVPGEAPINALIDEIRFWYEKLGASSIIPTDIVTTRFVAGNMESLCVGRSCLPSLDVFDLLNDKWRFFQYCEENGHPTPPTGMAWTFDQVLELLEAMRLSFPVVVKPRFGMAGEGVHVVQNHEQLRALERRMNGPQLVQKFIDGRDRDISILCSNGRLLAWAVQQRTGETYDFSSSVTLKKTVEDIASGMMFNGVAHFDSVEDPESGRCYLIECNPRFWYSIYALAMAGLNVVDLWLRLGQGDTFPVTSVERGRVDCGKALIGRLVGLRLGTNEGRMAVYYFSDPFGALADRLRLFRDDHSREGGICHQLSLLLALMRQQPSQPEVQSNILKRNQ